MKVAVILRGPPGVGKTTICGELVKLCNVRGHTVESVSLDDGWASGEYRFQGGASRYADLKVEAEVLLLELGYGEPEGLRFDGATKNPEEWLNLLADQGRAVFLWMLSAPRGIWLERLLSRAGDHCQKALHDVKAGLRYCNGQVCSHSEFSKRLPQGIAETQIDVSGDKPTRASEEIFNAFARANSDE